eukprot:m.64075 g.64075  ORF g.64075 m.64075 type:complete len:324 (+) comp13474_c5_seq1:276-1247(+)
MEAVWEAVAAFIASITAGVTALFQGNMESIADIRARVMPQDFLHTVARCANYPSGPARFPVEDAFVKWATPFPGYKPVQYEAPVLASQPVWADRPENLRSIQFNAVDKESKVDRVSAHGPYTIDENGLPLNPMGRTGITGRGLLGRYGPNHAADPVVTRWKRDPETHEVVYDKDGNPVLQFVAIQRRDCGLWALPGGMVDPGEVASATVKREFGEEALNSLELSDEEAEQVKQRLDHLFDPKAATVIYNGYVDDPRNTDNAWMETTAVSIHDKDGSLLDKFDLQSGDDASAVKWADYHPGMQLYASHTMFMAIAYEFRRQELA